MPQPQNNKANKPEERGYFGNLMDKLGEIFAAVFAFIAGIFGVKTDSSREASAAGVANRTTRARYGGDSITRPAEDIGTEASVTGRNRPDRDISSSEKPAPVNFVDFASDENRQKAKDSLKQFALFYNERDQWMHDTNQQRNLYAQAVNGKGDSRLQGEEFRGVRFREANKHLDAIEQLRLTPYKNPQPHPDVALDLQVAYSTKAMGAEVRDPSITKDEIFKRLPNGAIQVRTFGGDYRIRKLPESVDGVKYELTVYDAKTPKIEDIVNGKKISVQFEPARVILSQQELASIQTNDRYLQESISRNMLTSGTDRYDRYQYVSMNDGAEVSPNLSLSSQNPGKSSGKTA
jgi:hypothetical protein